MNPTPEEVKQFTTAFPSKSQPMTVTVIWPSWLANRLGVSKFTYEVPGGFQLDLYVAHLHPDCQEFEVRASHDEITVMVYRSGRLIETHRGVFWKL